MTKSVLGTEATAGATGATATAAATTATALEQLSGTTAIVTGASRGFGHAVSTVLCDAGVTVVGIARDEETLEKVAAELGDRFIPLAGDAADPDLARRLVAQYVPRTLVLNAGAVPLGSPISAVSWQDFNRHWESDVRHSLAWTQAALTQPLAPGSSVIAVSSGAALKGSPMSGGYAGAKATVRFIAQYAASESQQKGLGIAFSAVLPGMTPGTGVGEMGITTYAGTQGITEAEYVERLGAIPTVAQVGLAIAGLAVDPGAQGNAYRVGPGGVIVI